MTAPTVEHLAAETVEPRHTGGMVALVPADHYLDQLTVVGGDPAGQLHLTLAYLGDDVTSWPLANLDTLVAEMRDLAGMFAPIEGRVMGHALFNPDGGPDGDRDPCAVYLVGDAPGLERIRTTVRGIVEHKEGVPEHHANFLPHVTAKYGVDVASLTYTGPIVFDRLRVALADNVVDLPLRNGDTVTAAAPTTAEPVEVTEELDFSQRDAITAAALAMVDKLGPAAAYATAPLVFPTPKLLMVAESVIELPSDGDPLVASGNTDPPPLEWFTPPADLPPGTGHYVDGRRVYGRLAEWDVPHIGFDGRPIYAPRNVSGYRWFHTKSAWAQGPNGPERIKIGHLTFGIGHASTDPSVGHLSAAAHYDNSKYRGAKIRMSEDEYGPVYAGSLVAGMEGSRLEEFEESDTSGDWRRIMGRLELVAALCVNVGGFPKVGLSLAASGEPLALVASAKAWGQQSAVDYGAFADVVVDRIEQRAAHRELSTAHVALVDELDDTPAVVAALLTEVDDTPRLVADLLAELDDAALAAAASQMPAQLQTSYLKGEVAARIQWGTTGDFKRCVLQAKKHGMGRKAEGACAELHFKANGFYPGDKRNK